MMGKIYDERIPTSTYWHSVKKPVETEEDRPWEVKQPSPEAVAAMLAICKGKGRKAMERKYFGPAKRGPKPKEH